jgi:hypothetical protein
VITVREQGEEHAVRLGIDGVWRGAVPAATAAYSVRDGVLEVGWGLSSRPEGRYLRARSEPRGGPGVPPPAGSFADSVALPVGSFANCAPLPVGSFANFAPLPVGSFANFAPLPVGTFLNKELGAHAEVSADAGGAGTLQVGFAPPIRIEPVTDSAGAPVWRADRLTVRVEHEAGDGAPGDDLPGEGAPGLLISLLGAHHVRFGRVASAPADHTVIRGLSTRPIEPVPEAPARESKGAVPLSGD